MRTNSARPLLIALVLAGCAEREEVVNSSRASPNGSMIAESVFVDDGGGPADSGSSHLIIRSTRAENSYDQQLYDSSADFLRWIDDNHLEIWRERRALCAAPMPEMMGDVHIACRSYDPYIRSPGISAENITVPVDNVSVLFKQRPTNNGRLCVLSIETAYDPSYDPAKVEITVSVSNSCKSDRGRPCAGITSRFGLSERQSTVPQTMLTSVRFADIPTYTNRAPEGGEGTMIRGEFLEQNAVAVLESLKRSSIQIEYSRNFFDQVLKYDMPLTGHAKTLGEFDSCVGDADLLWTQHGR